MPPNKQRSTTLRKHRAELRKVEDEAQAAYIAAEDALTALEDRESRRAARTSTGQERINALRNRS
jgi:hypothetical protein